MVQVAHLAQEFAAGAAPDDPGFHQLAYTSGLLHDFGKYTGAFQDRIRGRPVRANHSIHGAVIAQDAGAFEAAFAIAGHHSGLPDPQGGRAGLRERIDQDRDTARQLREQAAADCPDLRACFEPNLIPPESDPGRFDVRTRMLLSCLADADRLDTARHAGAPDAEPFPPLHPAGRLQRLLDYSAQRAAGVAEGPVKQARNEVLAACLAAAANTAGNLFSLTVPAGGAKTVASMAFALRRAELFPERVRRIIVVIPYLSIIEQNAAVFTGALGHDAILEHHSNAFDKLREKDDKFVPGDEDDDAYTPPDRRKATENWDAPVIVTTSVRFFESLFSSRPNDLRRAHNIARSVVILDEVQTLPPNLLAPLLAMMNTLADRWGVTFLFCTATQPAFEKRDAANPKDQRWNPGTVREIITEPAGLFTILKRTNVEWRTGSPTPWSEIAAGMADSRCSLCIVNTRDHAAALFEEVERQAAGDGVFHLSTRMCASHRLHKLAEIRERLDTQSLNCLVVSTQLVEAGVDLDFPVVYRALGPLDSIAQAAGRCDREGKLTAKAGQPGGRVIVFETDDGKLPPGYQEGTDLTRMLAKQGRASIDDPEVIREYFERLYTGRNLGADLQKLRQELRFRTVGELFHMIADHTRAVVVPYNEEARQLIARLRVPGQMNRSILRKLQRYIVGLYPNEVHTGLRGAIEPVRDSELLLCRDGFYSPRLGIILEPSASQLLV